MKWFFSPSSQNGNGSHGYLEKVWCNQLADIIIPIMERHGEQCRRNDPTKTFREHVIAANAWQAGYIVPLHSNAIVMDDKTWQTLRSGPTVGCSHPDKPEAKGTILANLINDRLHDLWRPATKREVLKYTFAEVTQTDMPCAYVENFYHDNEADQKFAVENIEKIAIAICKACLEVAGKAYDGLEERRPMYRVQIGAFRNKDYADAFLAQITEYLAKDKRFDGVKPYMPKPTIE